MKAPKETDLVAACPALLKLRGVLAWRQNSGAVVLGSGKQRRFVQFVRGAKGVSDLLGVLPPAGRLLAIEAKARGKKPTPDQAAFLAAVVAMGGVGLVVRDVRELDVALAELLG